MTAPTSMRAQVKDYLVEELRPLLDELATTEHPVEISNGWPGKNLGRNHVWLDRVTGTVSFDLSMAGRLLRDDQFTVRMIFQASAPGDDLATTDARAESYCAAFLDFIATYPGLSTAPNTVMDGLIHAAFLDDAIEGPMGEFTDEGAVSFMFADLSVHTRT